MFKYGILVSILVILETMSIDACPNIVHRNEWDARPYKGAKQPLRILPPPYVVVHHSDTPPCGTETGCKNRVRGIQDYHMDHNKWNDIGYNFLIGGDGEVYEGRGWGQWGAHAPKYNARSIGICLIGNFQNTLPPTNQLEALKSLIACGQETGNIADNYHLIGHRQASATNCPGNTLFAEIENYPHFENNPE